MAEDEDVVEEEADAVGVEEDLLKGAGARVGARAGAAFAISPMTFELRVAKVSLSVQDFLYTAPRSFFFVSCRMCSSSCPTGRGCSKGETMVSDTRSVQRNKKRIRK